jgi:hypothetical protein
MMCLLVLACSASVVKAEGTVPVEGGWVATTSVGLPVSFEVKEGNVLNAHFGFSWGFCGTYDSHLPNTDPIDANGHWSFLDSRGQTIEGTFVAPDRVEGTVVAVERQLPSCPHTRATFGSLSFYGLKWRSFGGRKAYAIGRAAIRKGKQEWNPRASVRLSFLIEDGPDKRIYSIVRYVLHGSVPRGFDHHGFRAVG